MTLEGECVSKGRRETERNDALLFARVENDLLSAERRDDTGGRPERRRNSDNEVLVAGKVHVSPLSPKFRARSTHVETLRQAPVSLFARYQRAVPL